MWPPENLLILKSLALSGSNCILKTLVVHYSKESGQGYVGAIRSKDSFQIGRPKEVRPESCGRRTGVRPDIRSMGRRHVGIGGRGFVRADGYGLGHGWPK